MFNNFRAQPMFHNETSSSSFSGQGKKRKTSSIFIENILRWQHTALLPGTIWSKLIYMVLDSPENVTLLWLNHHYVFTIIIVIITIVHTYNRLLDIRPLASILFLINVILNWNFRRANWNRPCLSALIQMWNLDRISAEVHDLYDS